MQMAKFHFYCHTRGGNKQIADPFHNNWDKTLLGKAERHATMSHKENTRIGQTLFIYKETKILKQQHFNEQVHDKKGTMLYIKVTEEQKLISMIPCTKA